MTNVYKTTAPILLIYGGRGPEHEVSCHGAEHFLKVLASLEIPTVPIKIDHSGSWHICPIGDMPMKLPLGLGAGDIDRAVYPVRLGERSGLLVGGRIVRVAAAIPLLHGVWGEDGRVQGALECAGIPYVGCDVCSGAICSDKAYTKDILSRHGIPCLPHVIYCETAADINTEYLASNIPSLIGIAEQSLGYPMFLKPAELGSSIGTARVNCREALISALDTALALGSHRVILEPCLDIELELECAYLGAGRGIVTHPASVECGGDYSFDKKYTDKHEARLSARADIDEATAECVMSLARSCAALLGVRDLARIDFFLSGGKIYFNEINTFPGFTAGSLYPAMLSEAGIDAETLVGCLLHNCEERA